MSLILERMAKRCIIPAAEEALIGRKEAIVPSHNHFVLNTSLVAPFPPEMKMAVFAMGCFWGVERRFWQLEGVYSTAVGYVGGYTENPSYEEVCSGKTGHTEAVLVVYHPEKLSFEDLLIVFWESHDPTQGMRQGNDVGTQYRSGVFVTEEAQQKQALESRAVYERELQKSGKGAITSEIKKLDDFYYAEEYHQQYLAKNPNGYCGLKGTGVQFSDK